MTEPTRPADGRPIVVVGGAGFVGCNLANAYALDGANVRIVDNLSRPGAERNLEWLVNTHRERIDARLADIRDEGALESALDGAGAIFHMAAQVAVTTSMQDPRTDFMVNAAGTLNILEWVRTRAPQTPLVFASTNKVYGCLQDLATSRRTGRHEPEDRELATRGVGEDQPLSLQTPYGCSKGAADQYVLDYAHSFGLRTAVLRMSCIYGPRQFGNEDQGWVAHFALCALRGAPITIYGDGAQVRDVLHVADAVRAYRAVLQNIEAVKGEAFNLGGGPANAISLIELIDALRLRTGGEVRADHGDWRTGDQFWFVANSERLRERLGWRPQIGWREGLDDLIGWLREGVVNAGVANAVASAADLASLRRRSA